MSDHHYDVGYKKPPKKSQFRKGKSGNPRGRPKPPLDPQKLLISELTRRVAIIEGGKKRTITVAEAFIRSLHARALKGEKFATKLIYDQIKELPANAFEEEGVEVWTTRVTRADREKFDQFQVDADNYRPRDVGLGSSAT